MFNSRSSSFLFFLIFFLSQSIQTSIYLSIYLLLIKGWGQNIRFHFAKKFFFFFYFVHYEGHLAVKCKQSFSNWPSSTPTISRPLGRITKGKKSDKDTFNVLTFTENFLFGVAFCCFLIEWNMCEVNVPHTM